MNDVEYQNKEYNFEYRVSVLIYNKEKTKILVFYGNDIDFYMLPGGKVKEFEKSEHAIKKKIYEELGYENLKFEFVGVSEEFVTKKEDKIHEITMTYKCIYDGEIQEEPFKSKESDFGNFKWIDINEIYDYDIHPNGIIAMMNGEKHIVEEINFI